ncbi:hypothetical protein AGMMS4957_11070 [Bacteroidia bacterium]|nr:hypothetical protein AGMMS4957_11070 [Bacteroidia bacterium]
MSCDVLIIENDSKDDTKHVLSDWAQKSEGVYVISNDFGTQTVPPKQLNSVNPWFSHHRIEKMARYRNMYLEWIEAQNKDYDYMIVLDIDILWFNCKNFANIIPYAPDDWGALCANGVSFSGCRFRYYDLYPFSEVKQKIDMQTLGIRNRQERRASTLRVTKLIAKQPYTSVYSAFGGLAIYKYQAIKGLRYTAISNDDEEVESFAEHVSLNDAIIDRGYKVYIAKNLNLIRNI